MPLDHGVSLGPVSGLEDILATVRQVAAGGAGAVLVPQGRAKVSSEAGKIDCEKRFVHLSASTD